VKIIVCIKQVPDSEAKVTQKDGLPFWGDAKLVINPFDEYAVEAALQLKESNGASVMVISIGAETEKDAIKHALAMGADNAVLIADPAFAQIDSQGAAKVLAAAIKKIGDGDLIIFGRQTIDSSSGVTIAQTARAANLPLLSFVGKIEIAGDRIKVIRTIEEGKQNASAKMPAVLSIIQEIGEPRYPSFMGIRKASKAEIPIWKLSDLGIDAPATVVTRAELLNPPARDQACEIITGESPEQIADILADKIIAEKVL
jgi:electron transfer flavoprotein beta subunit